MFRSCQWLLTGVTLFFEVLICRGQLRCARARECGQGGRTRGRVMEKGEEVWGRCQNKEGGALSTCACLSSFLGGGAKKDLFGGEVLDQMRNQSN